MQVNDGQVTNSFIQTVATRISAFTDFLTSVKAHQRQQYAALLQQEQCLLQDLQAIPSAFEVDLPADLECDEAVCAQTGNVYSHQQSSQIAVAGQGQADAVQRSHRHDSPNKLRQRHSSSASSAAMANHHSSEQCSSTLLPEVVAYDQYLTRHGDTGGWHPDDHNTFLSILRSNRYSASILEADKATVPLASLLRV